MLSARRYSDYARPAWRCVRSVCEGRDGETNCEARPLTAVDTASIYTMQRLSGVLYGDEGVMNDLDGVGFQQSYARALCTYLSRPEERFLYEAYQLARRAVEEDLGPMEMAAIHHETLLTVCADAAERREWERCVLRAGEFLSEALAPFEMTHRGYLDLIYPREASDATSPG